MFEVLKYFKLYFYDDKLLDIYNFNMNNINSNAIVNYFVKLKKIFGIYIFILLL